jgi:DDE superfamily endonuclease
VVINLDEMGPQAAKSFRGKQLVRGQPQQAEDGAVVPAQRAKQAADYGRRGKGYIFGAFRPATGEAFTHPYAGRSSANWVDFLERVDGWLPEEADRVYAIVDNLSAHRATDVLTNGAS